MNREEIIKEIYKPLMAKIMSVEKKIDAYFADQNTERKTETTDNSDAIFELAGMVGELEESING